MNDKNKTTGLHVNLKIYILVLSLLWSAAIVLSILFNISEIKRNSLDLAYFQARESIKKDVLYRRWNSRHGGVYVPITTDTKANPYLKVPHRDIVTDSGQMLTLINPAYMTRQVHEIAGKEAGVKGHITSLNPIRPANAPDPWETEALTSFQQGKSEFSSVGSINGVVYFRLMQPLITEKGCLQCHAEQRYKEGEIRGGISVSIPVAPFLAGEQAHINRTLAGHGFLWVVGLLILVAGMKRLNNNLMEYHKRSTREVMESEAGYRRIFNDSITAIYILDIQKKFVDSNKAGLDLLGYSREELLGLSLIDVSLDTLDTEQACGRLLNRQEITNREHQLKKKSGETITVLDNSISITDLSDNVIGIQSTIINITKRKQAEEKIISDQVFLNTLFEAIPIPLYFKDSKGRYMGVNKAFETLYGSDRSSLIGKTVFEAHPPEQAQIYFKNDQALLESGGTQEYEAKMKSKTGIFRDIVLNKAVYSDSSGNNAGIIGTAQDITVSRRNDRIQSVRILLSEFSLTNSVQDLLRRFLDEAEKMTDSSIGFFHFVEPDQETLSLQMWSTNTLEQMCSIDLSGTMNTHYSISEAGVWIDCIREQKPVVHNDYKALENRKGLPDGHAPVVRELVIPVFRGEKIVAVLGVGNKETDYNADDVQTVSEIADIAWDIVFRKQAEEALRNSEEKYRTMMEAMIDPAYICSDQFVIKYMNPAMVKWLGRDCTGEPCYSSIYDMESQCSWCSFEQIKNSGDFNYTLLNPKDNRRYNVSNSPIVNADGSIFKLTIFRDITEILNLERQLRQVQKLEAIGTLAGGIAHDFNNILFSIMGYAELSLSSLNQQDQVRNDINQILKAAHRAKDLVQQILTFSRQTEQEMQPIAINFIIKEALKLLKASLPATIDIRTNIASKSKILGDPTQIHQVVMNLCTNSAHAMEENGGLLTVELLEIEVKDDLASRFIKMPTGKYLHLKISDTGHGIRKMDIDRIFEPFYTTKPEGKGTGLGLSLVHGIIRNHKGQIAVTSDPGQGSLFDVYLPLLESGPDGAKPEQLLQELPGGDEKILVVDDEENIIKITKRSLTRHGYLVDGVTDPNQAIEIVRQSPLEYDMVITDMTMPGMTGDSLAKKLMAIRPDLPVLLITGFSNKIDLKSSLPENVKKVLLKPVIKSDFLLTIRKLFDKAKNN